MKNKEYLKKQNHLLLNCMDWFGGVSVFASLS